VLREGNIHKFTVGLGLLHDSLCAVLWYGHGEMNRKCAVSPYHAGNQGNQGKGLSLDFVVLGWRILRFDDLGRGTWVVDGAEWRIDLIVWGALLF
jgi:hypothetical protein